MLDRSNALITILLPAVMETIDGLEDDVTVIIIVHQVSPLMACERLVEL